MAALGALLALLTALGLSAARSGGGGGGGPLVVWSTESSLWPPLDTPGGQELTEEQLERILGPGLQQGPRTVLLFLQEQLSLQDFTAFGGVFGNEAAGAFGKLQAALSSSGSSLALPRLSRSALSSLPLTLQRLLGAPEALRLPGAKLGAFRVNGSEPELILVGLPHSRSSSLLSPREVLSSNDAVLGEVLQLLQEEQIPYTAMLSSAGQPLPGGLGGSLGDSLGDSLGGSPGVSPPFPRRSLLGFPPGGSSPPPPLRWPPQGDPKMLLWAQNLSVWFGGQHRDLTPLTFGEGATVELGGSSWSPQEARFVLQYKEVFGKTLNITFLLRLSWFPVSARRWSWLEELSLALDGAPAARFGLQGAAAAPEALGWSCAQLESPKQLRPLGGDNSWRVTVRRLQIQAFNVSGGVFGAASDCSTFFSAGGWMGLISCSLLLWGFLLGISVLLGLRPMDRFDDPRGPPLPVPLGE